MGEREAVDAALRALRHRDLSAHELRQRLGARGFGEAERDEAIDTLVRTGLLDDGRFAQSRARSLATRGAGDRYIRHVLGEAGIASELVDEALATLEPEVERARDVVERRGASPKTLRYLSGKGFSADVVAGIVAGHGDDELG